MLTVVIWDKGMTQIASERHGFEKHFGQDDRGADIQIDAAFHPGDHGRQAPKVQQRGRADRRSVRGRMHVNDVGADGDMDRDGNAEFAAGGQNARAHGWEIVPSSG